MELGIFGVGDIVADAYTGIAPTEFERIHTIMRIAKHAEEVGLDVYAIGEHHNPPFISSADSTLLAYLAAQTERITLSTSTTLITTNDPVKIAEDFATLQLLAKGRVDIMLGRGNTAEVYPWFGQDIRKGIPLAIENYALLHRLWREEKLDWEGSFRAPLRNFTSVPRPLDGKPPFVWHGSIRSPEIAEQAGFYGDGFFVNNMFMTMSYFKQFTDFYRQRFAFYGHGKEEDAIVGAGGILFVRPNSQDARREVVPYFRNSLISSSGADLAQIMVNTGMTVGSPAEVIEKTLSFTKYFGDYQRQLFVVDFGGMSEKLILEELDLIGAEVLPVLRSEFAKRKNATASVTAE